MNKKIYFSLDNNYVSKLSFLMDKTNSKHNKDLLKILIDSYIVLTDEEEELLKKFFEKTFYTREKFFKEAVEKHVYSTIKKNSKLFIKKVNKSDEKLKLVIDEMIDFYKQNEDERKFINSNTVNNYLKENKKYTVNMEVIKRVINNYKPILDYHNEYNLNQFFNIDKALKKRLAKDD